MDKIIDFFDEIQPLFEAKNFNREHAAILILGSDFNDECVTYQGTIKSLVGMLVSAMEQKKELSYIILKASETFLERLQDNKKEPQDEVQ